MSCCPEALPLEPHSPGSCDDCHMHIAAHEADDVADHLIVCLHVSAIGIQGAISIKGDQLQLVG